MPTELCGNVPIQVIAMSSKETLMTETNDFVNTNTYMYSSYIICRYWVIIKAFARFLYKVEDCHCDILSYYFVVFSMSACCQYFEMTFRMIRTPAVRRVYFISNCANYSLKDSLTTLLMMLSAIYWIWHQLGLPPMSHSWEIKFSYFLTLRYI